MARVTRRRVPRRRSTPSSARWPTGAARARSACWPAPAPARPGRSPTGSPTACTPACSTPRQVLAVTFTARAAGEMRGRLRELGAGGVQARHVPLRRAAPAAVLLAARRRRRAARAHRAQGPRCSPRRRAVRLPLGPTGAAATSPPRSSGPRSTRTSPDDYAAARRRRRPRRARGLDAGDGGARLYAGYEDVKRARGSSTSRTSCS